MANFEIGGELAVEISWIARGPKKKPGHYDKRSSSSWRLLDKQDTPTFKKHSFARNI